MIVLTIETPGLLVHRIKDEIRRWIRSRLLFGRVCVITITHKKILIVIEGNVASSELKRLVELAQRYGMKWSIERVAV